MSAYTVKENVQHLAIVLHNVATTNRLDRRTLELMSWLISELDFKPELKAECEADFARMAEEAEDGPVA